MFIGRHIEPARPVNQVDEELMRRIAEAKQRLIERNIEPVALLRVKPAVKPVHLNRQDRPAAPPACSSAEAAASLRCARRRLASSKIQSDWHDSCRLPARMNKNTPARAARAGSCAAPRDPCFPMRAATARAPGAPRRLVRRTLQVLAALALLAPAFAAADLVFTRDPPRDAEVDRPYVYTMAAADDEDDDDDRRRPRGPAVRFFVLDSPAWLAFDGTDTLSGTPRERDVGGHRVRLTARRRGETASQTFTI